MTGIVETLAKEQRLWVQKCMQKPSRDMSVFQNNELYTAELNSSIYRRRPVFAMIIPRSEPLIQDSTDFS